MADIVDHATRSRMMSGIRGRDTKPELIVRRGLHRLGFRYRLYAKELPGRPDLLLPAYGAAIFVQGCFWHKHDCMFFKWPATRRDFWRKKITGNSERDKRVIDDLIAHGWRVAVIWECALKGAGKDFGAVIRQVAEWLNSNVQRLEVEG